MMVNSSPTFWKSLLNLPLFSGSCAGTNKTIPLYRPTSLAGMGKPVYLQPDLIQPLQNLVVFHLRFRLPAIF